MLSKIKQLITGKKWWIPFLILLVAFTAMRGINITADAPQDLSISAALYTDEGFKTYSSRNYAYYGGWKWTPEDEYSGWYSRSVVPAAVYNLFFKAFGVNFISLRMPTIILSVMTMILLFFFVRRYYDVYTAWTAFILYGLNHVVMMYSRLAFYENFLVFFALLALFMFGEFFRRLDNVLRGPEALRFSFPAEVLITGLCLAAGISAVIAGYMSKESMNIILVAMVPFAVLYFFYSKFSLNFFVVHVFYLMILLIILFYAAAGHTQLFDIWFKSIHNMEIFGLKIGSLIPLKTNVGNFDPFYLSLAKSLFLEFVYNQPLTFFTGIFFAIMCFYRFLYQSKCNVTDMILSSWLLFCFLFLSIMKYHPARYYLLVSVPLIILSARFIISKDYINLAALTRRLNVRSFLFVTSMFWFYFVFYAGVVFFMVAAPFSYRKKLYDFVYSCIQTGSLENILPVVFLIITIQIFFFLMIVPKIRTLKKNLEAKKLFTAILILSVVFNVFLYGRWLVTSTSKLHDISVKLGQNLSPDSVLAGGWGPGLCFENSLRSAVMQGELNYNTRLVDEILSGKEIPVIKKKDGIPFVTYEKNMPVYILVSLNAPFEKKMAEVYSRFITEERRVFTSAFGYFNVDMYRIDRLPGKEKEALKDIR